MAFKFLKFHKKLRGNYWAVIGTLVYLIVVVYCVIKSFGPYSLLDNVFMVIDWAAACVIYFFYAAMIGLIFDRKKFPMWAKLALFFWAVSSLTVGIFSREGALSPALVMFFPFAFGIFLTGTAFNMFFSDILTKFIYFKMMLDVLFLATFFSWMNLEIRGKSEKIRRILLYSIFIIFLLGLIGCAKSLS